MDTTRAANFTDTILGKRIRAAREARGMTQGQLGRSINVTFQQVQKYESAANRVSVSRLVLIANALGVSPAQFVKDLGAHD